MIAANRVLEVLESMLEHPRDAPPVDVIAAFLRVAFSAVAHGYAEAWFAMDLVDRVLRRIAREYPDQLANASSRALIVAIVEAFLGRRLQKAFLLARDLDLSVPGEPLRR